MGTRHSDVPFFQGIVQVTSSFVKIQEQLLFSCLCCWNRYFSVPFSVPLPTHQMQTQHPASGNQLLYILILILLYSRGVKLILAQGPHGGKSILKWAGLVKSWHKTLKITTTLDCKIISWAGLNPFTGLIQPPGCTFDTPAL